MNNYENLLTVREDLVDGHGPWYWAASDNGAWEGPHKEFIPIKDACLEYVKDRKFIVQAGGNLGLYPRLWANYFANVFTFEPDPFNFYILNKNCQKDNIFKFQAALSNVSEMTHLYRHYDSNLGMHSMDTGRKTEAAVVVKTMTVDSLNLPGLDLLQLDVEGYELQALEGAFHSITKYLPVITVETHTTQIQEFLRAVGYEHRRGVASDHVYSPAF